MAAASSFEQPQLVVITFRRALLFSVPIKLKIAKFAKPVEEITIAHASTVFCIRKFRPKL